MIMMHFSHIRVTGPVMRHLVVGGERHDFTATALPGITCMTFTLGNLVLTLQEADTNTRPRGDHDQTRTLRPHQALPQVLKALDTGEDTSRPWRPVLAATCKGWHYSITHALQTGLPPTAVPTSDRRSEGGQARRRHARIGYIENTSSEDTPSEEGPSQERLWQRRARWHARTSCPARPDWEPVTFTGAEGNPIWHRIVRRPREDRYTMGWDGVGGRVCGTWLVIKAYQEGEQRTHATRSPWFRRVETIMEAQGMEIRWCRRSRVQGGMHHIEVEAAAPQRSR